MKPRKVLRINNRCDSLGKRTLGSEKTPNKYGQKYIDHFGGDARAYNNNVLI